MADDALVSVIIPAYNAEAFLADAVESVLAQAHRPLEIVVVDDGSTDGTARVAATFGDSVRYQRQPNGGPPRARNQGLMLARGEIVAFLDADDLYVPDKLALQLPRLASNPAAEVVLGRNRYLLLRGEAGGGPSFEPHLEPPVSLQLGCALFRRRVFERVGHFDEALRQSDDWDWFMRCRELGVGLLLHRDVVLEQRIHGGNLTRQREENQRLTLRMFKQSLDRRRRLNDGCAESLMRLSAFLESDGPKGNGRDR